MSNGVTIVSIVPYALNEFKPGQFPGYYTIPAAKENDISVLHIDDAFYYLYLDEERGHQRVNIPAKTVAEGLINDYVTAQVVSGKDAHPGVMVIDGVVDKEYVKKNFKTAIDDLKRMQTNWFMILIRQGDDLWNKFHKHQVLSDLHRFACDYLKLEREWNVKPNDTQVKCPACFEFINSEASICSHCHTIVNEEKYKKFKRVD